MRIVRATLREVTNTLVNPFHASSHSTQALHHILVTLEDESGAVGWGESATLEDPYYLGETTTTCWHILSDFLIPRVLGKPWETIEQFVGTYHPLVKGNAFAKAGIEMAAWDLLGRVQGKSVASLLGGTRTEIASGVSLGIEKDMGRLIDLVRQYEGEGYRRVKLKIARGADVSTLGPVREAFPTMPLMADANAAYTLADADHLKSLDAFDLLMIEQPLDYGDIFDHAKLQARIATRVCLDESLRSAKDAEHALALGSCKVVNVKVARLGGLLEAKRTHDVCHAQGIPVWCGGMHDFGIGRAANLALASLPGFSIPGDVSGFDKYFVEDIVEPPIVARGGMLAVPHDRPGLGHEPILARIDARTVRKHEAKL